MDMYVLYWFYKLKKIVIPIFEFRDTIKKFN